MMGARQRQVKTETSMYHTHPGNERVPLLVYNIALKSKQIGFLCSYFDDSLVLVHA